ncbi:hypothetical protein [Nostoc sp.]|uniref:hypothetical protein n=1 Tax=Nostoc sp. TaxID=1180 RepID=UPI002FF46581
MVNSNFSPQDKKPGDLILSADWNAAISEIKCLQQAKVNREGADTLKGPLTIQEALNVTGDVKISGNITVNNTVSLKGSADTTGLSVNASGYVGIGTSEPKIHLAIGDDGTGLQQEDDGELAIYTDNTERMRINASGNVGIGTTSPTEKLEVNGNIKATNAAFAGTLTVTGYIAIGDGGTALQQQDDGELAIYTDNTERMTINASGNVGIGTSKPKIHLAIGDDGTGLQQEDDGELAIYTDNTERMRINASGNVGIGTSEPKIHLAIGDDGTGLKQQGDGELAIYTDNTERMRINASGNVGIGTTSPTEKLDVSGKLKATNAAFTDTLTVTGKSTLNGSLTVNNTVSLKGSATTTGLSVNASGNVGIGTTTPKIHLAIGDDDTGLKQQGDGQLAIYTDNVERVRINASGNVGIGTNNPTKAKLEIVGYLNNVGLDFAFFNGKNETGKSKSDYSAFYSLYAEYRIACLEFNALSDARIKLIQARSNSNADLRLLRQIEITDYTLKDTINNLNEIHKKVIGQQIARIFPQAVSTITDVVPDIFKSAFISNKWINLPDHKLTVGERVKIIQGTEANVFTVEAIELDSFKIPLSYNGEVFVYGREVNDFHVVDYDALSMLNISATQELYRIIETLQTEVEQLKAQLHQNKPNKLPISEKQ